MSEGELDRLRRVVERLMAGHREALGVIDQEVEDRESSAQETLAEVQDILSGAYEDARTILGEGGTWRTDRTKNVRGLRGKRTSSGEKIRSAALAICRKRGGAITRVSRRKSGRVGQRRGIRLERTTHRRWRCAEAQGGWLLLEESHMGKRRWKDPETGRMIPGGSALDKVECREEQELEEAGWEQVEVHGRHYWRRPDTGHLYPRGPAYDVHKRGNQRWGSNYHDSRTVPDVWNLYLPRSSRAILKKMNPLPKWGIMARCKLMFAVRRRECRVWTWFPRSEFWANPPGEVCLCLSYVPIMCTRTQSGHIPLAFTHNTHT
jgi:hypothetical protein